MIFPVVVSLFVTLVGTLAFGFWGGLCLGLSFVAGYYSGRADGAQHYREQEAERMTRTGAT